MKKPSVSLAIITAIAFVLVVGGSLVFISFTKKQDAALHPVNPNYKDPSLSIDTRVDDLLSQMTLDEKIGQMALIEKNSITNTQDIAEYGLGALLSGGGEKPATNTPEGWFQMVNGYNEESRSSRFGIPILYGIDAMHGNSNVPGATIFPHAIGLGAANDPELVKKIAAATAEEVKATGISWVFSPDLDAPQDIRWGRTYEAFSNDSNINASLGAAFVEGLQATTTGDTGQVGMIATAKHYLGAGGMVWGSSSNKDFKIDQGTTPLDEKTLRDFYLPPFKAAVDAGVLSVMAGLNSIDDSTTGGSVQKISTDKYLLTDVLKNELGFKGFVVSDWYGVYMVPGGDYNAAVKAINAGIDMVMLPFDYKTFVTNVDEAVRNGSIPQERIDDAVRRILRAKFAAGLFEKNPETSLSVVGSAEHRDLARQAVARSLVLLKNDTQTLPLASKSGTASNSERILVSGSSADNTGRQSGAWTIEWQGVDGNTVPGATSILAGIRAYDQNVRFATTTADGSLADVGIAVVGEKPYAEGWGDNPDLTLSVEDLQTIASLRKASKKVIVIIVSGRPLLLPVDAKNWDAIIAAWLPGSEGEGIADVLFGKDPFTGKLPLPWPANLSQVPFSPEGISADKTKPMFGKGFGL